MSLRTALVKHLPTPVRIWNAARVEWNHGEPELHFLPALCRREATSIDVGANRGSWSYCLAKYSRDVVSIEANPTYIDFLRRGFALRGKRIEIIHAAASDHEGEMSLRMPLDPMLGALSTVEAGNALQGHPFKTVSVRVIRVDSVKNTPVGLIKIDVEGHELAVLQGCRGILLRDRPNLIMEAEERHRPDAVPSIVSYLGELGYRGFFRYEGRLHPIERFETARHQRLDPVTSKPVNPYAYNFLFVQKGDSAVIERLAAVMPMTA